MITVILKTPLYRQTRSKGLNFMSKKYEKRLCLFLDVLGFSDLVKNSNCAVVDQVVLEIKNELKSNKVYINEIGHTAIATTFSDCIVLSIEVNDFDVVNATNVIVTATVKMLQDTYLNQNISLRGGISYGDLYHQNDNVFGPAMIEAYKLESQFADWPRVIFARSVIDHFDDSNKLPSIGFNNYGDGFWGVDCLTRISDVLVVEHQTLFQSDIGKDNLDKLFNIYGITKAKLAEHYGNPKVYSKYLMLDNKIHLLMKKFNLLPHTLENMSD